MMRRLLARLSCAAFLLFVAASIHAQNLPPTIKIVVGYPAGAAVDLLARIVAERLAKQTNTSVIVENVAGAGGALALNRVVAGSTDGSMILLASVNDVLLDVQAGTAKTQQALAPLGSLANVPAVLIGRADLAAANTDELVQLARQPGTLLSIGGTGTGTMSHVQVAGLERDMKARLNYIPYKGASITMTDVIGGSIDLALVGLPSVLQYLNTGKIRVYGVNSMKRSSLAPQLPTLLESDGMKASKPVGDSWTGLMVSSKVPAEVQKTLASAVARVSAGDDIRQQIQRIGLDPDAIGADELRRQIQRDHRAFATLVKESKIKAE